MDTYDPETSVDRAMRRYRASPKGKYVVHKKNAKRRGVVFLLTFDQWWDIWRSSGYWDLRGCKPGQYVMCRLGDEGAYEVGNVYIGAFYTNFLDGMKNMRRRHTAKTTTVTFDEDCGF